MKLENINPSNFEEIRRNNQKRREIGMREFERQMHEESFESLLNSLSESLELYRGKLNREEYEDFIEELEKICSEYKLYTCSIQIFKRVQKMYDLIFNMYINDKYPEPEKKPIIEIKAKFQQPVIQYPEIIIPNMDLPQDD